MNRAAWAKAAGMRERTRIAFDRQVQMLQTKIIADAYAALQRALRDTKVTEEQ
jgi:hypothetical protein